MIIVEEYYILNNVTMRIEERNLMIEERALPVLKVEVIPAPEQDINMLSFYWNVTAYSEQYIEFQLNFTNALYVSSKDEADLLRITFNDPDLFVSQGY